MDFSFPQQSHGCDVQTTALMVDKTTVPIFGQAFQLLPRSNVQALFQANKAPQPFRVHSCPFTPCTVAACPFSPICAEPGPRIATFKQQLRAQAFILRTLSLDWRKGLWTT